MEAMISSSSYFGRMEHGSTIRSRDVSRGSPFQNPFECPDSTAYIMSSGYRQIPMMASNSALVGSEEEPFRYGVGEEIGTVLGMETMFGENLSSSISQTDWWPGFEQLSSQSTLGMDLFNTTPQDVFSNSAHTLGSTIAPDVDIMPMNQDLKRVPSSNWHSLIPSKNTHLLNTSRSCSPTPTKLEKLRRARCNIINKTLVRPKRNRNETKLRKDRRLRKRALAILKTEFRFNPQPDQHTMQAQAHLIGSTFDDISQWFDQMRRQNLQSHLNQDRLRLRHIEPSSRDRLSSTIHARKGFKDHSGVIQKFDSAKRCKEKKAAWNTQKKKWQCTTSTCMKRLKNRSEWVRHENTHGQPNEYICMSRGCSRAVLGSAVPCQSCTSGSQRSRQPIASCQCQTSEKYRFKRKDKLQEHLRKQHNLLLPSSVVSGWTEQINRDFRSCCGFCGEHLETWEVRLSHIAEHFEGGWEMSSWNETLTEEVSDEEEEEEENSDEDMPDSDEMEWDSDDDNGDASLDGLPEDDAENDNQDKDSGDRGSKDVNDTDSNEYWQDFSQSTRNSFSLTTANLNSYYALFAIIYHSNFKHEVYALEKSQFYVATFHTNQDRVVYSLPEPPQQTILALVSKLALPKGVSIVSLLQSTFSNPRQQCFVDIHLVQALTSSPSLLHETVYALKGSQKSHTTMGHLLPVHRSLPDFRRLLRGSKPYKLDSLHLSMFPGLRSNDKGLLYHAQNSRGRGPQMIYHEIPRALQDVTYSALDYEPIGFPTNGNSGKNSVAKVLINVSPADFHNFADRCSALSNISHVPVPIPRKLSASLVSYRDTLGKSSPYLDFSIPFERNKSYVERGSILHSMKQAIESGPSRRIVLHGLGGMGKTQTALEFAYRYRADFTSIFWVNDRGGFNINSQRESTTIEHISRLLRADSSSWLLIMDNFDDISVFDDLWCNQFSGSIVATTRNKNFGSLSEDTGQTDIFKFPVGPLESKESAELFLKIARPASQAATNDQDISRLAELLGGLPLAIELASAYMRKTKTTISQYLNLFKMYEEKLANSQICVEEDTTLLSQPISQDKVITQCNPDPVPDTVFRTWSISFEMIISKHAAATQLLSLLSLYDGINQVHEGLGKRSGAATKLEDQASLSRSCLISQLRYSFPEQLAAFSEQQIEEGLDLLLDLSMVVLRYAATMVEVHRQSKEVMQLITQSSRNKMDSSVRPGIGVVA